MRISSPEARECAARALGLDSAASLRDEELSVAFKYALVDALSGWEEDGESALDALCAGWNWSASESASAARQALAYSAPFRQRLVELARDARMSQPLAPELCIAPHPPSAQRLRQLLPAAHNHAVVCAATALFTHELYPLVVDAFSADSTALGRAHFNVLGVHVDWIDDGNCARRAIFFDMESQRFVEAPLDAPLPIDSAHFLSLGRDEQALHRAWSARLSVPQVNPWDGARLADDKAATIVAWERCGLEVPTTCSVAVCDGDAARHFIERHAAVVAKPNDASEGRGVAYLDSPSDWMDYARTQTARGDALLQARRDGVFFRGHGEDAVRTLALRINVGTCGARRCADSHYVQLGTHDRSPASRGRGGRIASVASLRDQLVYRRDGAWQPIALDPVFWRETIEHAERAAALFADLLLVGIDLVIDVVAGRPCAVLLEANPRPAGLCHAQRMGDGKAGVSETLWNGLRARIA